MRLPTCAALIAAVLSAAPARAQGFAGEVRVTPLPAEAAAAPLAPALLAAYALPGGPFASLLSAGSARIAAAARAGASDAAAPVLQSLAAGEPLERAAAAALALALTDTRAAAALVVRSPELIGGDLPRLAARGLPLGAAAPLAAAARRDPALAFIFDGRAEPAAGTPDGAALDGEDLIHAGGRTPALGRGAFGLVHPHPNIAGAVIKTDLPRNPSDGDSTVAAGLARLAADRAAAEEAARIGAGPRLLGEGFVGERPALVKERVYGHTVAALLADGRFGPVEHASIEELFGTLARYRKIFFDVGPENVMIGRTLGDARVRAYLTDGGLLLPAPAGAATADLVENLFGRLRQLAFPHALLARFDRVHFAGARP